MKSSLLLLAFAALAAHPAAAQTRRAVLDYQLWAEIQGELALKNGDYLLLAVQGQNTPAFNNTPYTDRILGFDTQSAGIAYEHFWSDHWSGGGALQYTAYGTNYVTPGLLLRHRSRIGPLTFGQRLSGYRSIPLGMKGYFVGYQDPESANFLSLRVDLERLLPLGGGSLALRPRLSYEAITHVVIQKPDPAPEPGERTIQYTSLRAEVGVRINDHFDFTPWFAYTTAYYFTIGQYGPIAGPPPHGRWPVKPGHACGGPRCPLHALPGQNGV